ncbi:MAG: Ldh family oxidoreductase, partial [Acidimicrobiia bacterium]|nr:Ldh family oxidoreductase [Acidimicrobiia bacterium]
MTVRRQSHMGRLGWYSARLAEQGIIGFVTADSGRAPKYVAPHGGRSRRLGTNPLSFAFPADVDGQVVLDMATSTVARGKINVAAARGESIPTGWLVDKEGKDTTDPRALANGGALLPFGADQA